MKKGSFNTTKQTFVIALLTIITACNFSQTSHPQNSCESSTILSLPDVTITSVTQETQYAPHCKISGVIGKAIKFELLLPKEWNGKFVMGGGGGYVGEVVNFVLPYQVLEKGYATVGTDAGHEGHNLDGSWALNNIDALVDFGHRAVHLTTTTSKAIIEAYYNQKISYSYFVGCSRGGGQALMEAQRYPEDFDGIVSGAPAYNWTHGLGAGMTHNVMQMYPDPTQLNTPLLSAEDLKLVEDTYLEMCDELDGIKDRILTDPRKCDFDPSILLCKGENNKTCLTNQQVAALKAIYEGPKDKEGNKLYSGFPLGAETHPIGWPIWITGGLSNNDNMANFHSGAASKYALPNVPNAQYAFGIGVLQNFIYNDSTWTYKDYHYENFNEDSKLIGKVVNADDPDLSKFRNKGGKLMMFTGWSDMGVSPLGTIDYFEEVIANDATASKDAKLFMMPGVLHCMGGDGPWYVNWVDEIDNWVAHKKDPNQITVYFVDEKMQPDGGRLLCPYPEVPTYDKKGSTRDPKSFKCSVKK